MENVAESRIFLVYEHWRTDKNQCFYVGKGKLRRASDMNMRNAHHKAIVAKVRKNGFGIDVRIVRDGMTNDEACALEVERIGFWRAQGIALANYTNGGDGMAGWKMSPESRKRLSVLATGRRWSEEMRQRMKGRKRSPETIAKMSASRKGGKWSESQREKMMAWCLSDEARAAAAARATGRTVSEKTRAAISRATRGRVLSDEHRRKIAERNLGRKWSEESRDRRRGHEVSEETRKKIGAASKGNKYRLGATLSEESKEKIRQAQFRDEAIENWQKFSHLGPKAMAKRVRCVDDGREFESASEAARYYGFSKSAIIELCNGNPRRKTVGGMIFEYMKEAA